MKKSERKINKATETLIASATKLYLGEHKNQYGLLENDVYCISFDTLIEEEKLFDNIREKENLDASFVKVTVGSNKNLSYEAVESCTEINTTPSIPDDPDIVPDENSKAPVIEFTGSDIIPDTQTTFDALEGVIITDDNTPRSEIKVNVIGEVSLGIVGRYPIVYEAIDRDSNVTTKTRIIEVLKTEYLFPYTGSYQEFTVPIDGDYKIELWGAQGYNTKGKGAYTSGIISLKGEKTFYIYVGEGNNAIRNGTSFNGGTANFDGVPGGGATDIRLVSGDWNNFESLKSRIMVAAGSGSGSENNTINKGYGGALIGGNGSGGTGGTQTSAGTRQATFYSNSGFGYANGGVSGGGGYYGGGASSDGGGGGSSFISGYPGCNAITKESTSTNIIHTGDPNHYSGYVFKNSIMKAGNEEMPTHDGTSTMTGNTGNGYAKITYIIE